MKINLFETPNTLFGTFAAESAHKRLSAGWETLSVRTLFVLSKNPIPKKSYLTISIQLYLFNDRIFRIYSHFSSSKGYKDKKTHSKIFGSLVKIALKAISLPTAGHLDCKR